MHNGVRRAKLRGSHRDSVARHVRFPGEREGRWIMGKVNSSSMSAMGMKYQTITYQLDACPNCASLRAEVERLRSELDCAKGDAKAAKDRNGPLYQENRALTMRWGQIMIR